MTEYEKMHNGMIYDCLTEELGELQKHSHRLCEQYNRLGVDDAEERRIAVGEDGALHDFEYGKPIKIGNDVWNAPNVTVCAYNEADATLNDVRVCGYRKPGLDLPAGQKRLDKYVAAFNALVEKYKTEELE